MSAKLLTVKPSFNDGIQISATGYRIAKGIKLAFGRLISVFFPVSEPDVEPAVFPGCAVDPGAIDGGVVWQPCPPRNLKRYGLYPRNPEYQVLIAMDGDAWGAVLGFNLQEGFCGFGETIPDALRNLADDLENATNA